MVPCVGRVERNRSRRRDGLDAPQSLHDLTGRCSGEDLHLAAAGLSGLGGVLRRDVERPHPAGGGFQCHRQHAGHGPQAAVQRQLTQKGGVLRRRFQLPGGRQHGQQQGQVVHRAGLADVCRGEVDGDAAVGPLEAQILQGRMNAVATLPDGRVRQADDGKRGQPAGNIGFHRNGKAAQPVQAKAVGHRIHGVPPCMAHDLSKMPKVENNGYICHTSTVFSV